MTLQRYIPTFFQAVGTEERWAGMREDSQDGAWYAAADVDQRIATLEAALRTIAAYRGKNAVAHQLAYIAEAALDSETPPQPDGDYTDSIDIEPSCGTSETEVKSRMTHAEAIAMIRSDSRLRVDESPFKETACKHPLETMNHHGSVTGIVNDFRCTLCDLVMPLTDEEVSRWYGLHSKAETGAKHGT